MSDSSEDSVTTGGPAASSVSVTDSLAASVEICAQERKKAEVLTNVISVFRFINIVALLFTLTAVGATPGATPILATVALFFVFLGLALWHGSVIDRRNKLRRQSVFFQRSSDRRNGHFAHKQGDGANYVVGDHPYALDCDIVGPGSLYFCLNTTMSALGAKRLASILLSSEETWSTERQQAVKALVPLLDWRARLYASGDERAASDAPVRMYDWVQQPPPRPSRLWLWFAGILSALLAVGIAWLGYQHGVWALLWSFIGSVVLCLPINKLALKAMGFEGDPDYEQMAVAGLATALERVEELRALDASPHIQDLAARAENGGQALRQLVKRIDALSRRRNPLWSFGPGAIMLAEWWNLHRLHDWADAYAQHIADWQLVAGEAEAIAALATWADEQGGCWPQWSDEGPALAVEDLGHPLISTEKRIGNPLTINDAQVLLLTGANASGKSTFLRSCALAYVLARAGTTVAANSCHTRPMGLATVMRAQDSLQQGQSRFQAEVAALTKAVQTVKQSEQPILLILDEILGGTNSRERHLGTEAIIRHLADSHGVVMVSTHDLELPELAAEDGERFMLAHFADRAGADDVAFDYILRDGVIQSTNALKVMRAAGLPV